MAAPPAAGASKPIRPLTPVQTVRRMEPVRPAPPAPTPPPGPLEPAPRALPTKGRPKLLWTIIGVVAAIILGAATAALVEEDLTTGERAILGALGTVVALVGLVGLRWGWYVLAGVTAAFFLLNMYNLLNPEGTVFDIYRGSSYTFAVLLPAVGVAVGAVGQALYRFVGGR